MRETDPATTSFAHDLGGGWVWAFDSEECATSAQLVPRSAPLIEGSCVEVAPKSANPGYDVDADPAPPLRGIVGGTGAC